VKTAGSAAGQPAVGSPGGESFSPIGRHSVELALATEVAARAGELLVDRLGRVQTITHKSPKDVVTEVDHLSEELILEAIRSTFPNDGLLAEESGQVAGDSGRVWVVDPLDGTINYANGIPVFCVSVALVVDGRPAVGVVHDPTRLETFSAAAGGQARLDGRPITASDKERLSDFVVSLALGGRSVATRARNVRKAIRVSRSMGSAALALAYVSNGRFDAFVQQGGLSSWDIAAAGLIAERAGAKVTDLGGGPWFDLARPPRSIGVLAAPGGAHHRALLELVR
jgi:myo-inositol-1(or 4)-monophosphatase